MPPAVFLDRDNTLIHNDGDLGDPGEVRLIHGIAPAIASLCGLGYKIVVITNQGGVARGNHTEEDVHAVHKKLARLVKSSANGARIDAFYYCPFHPEGRIKKYKQEHPNRKPQPGMLLEAAEDLKIELDQSWTIGDQLRDVQAGSAAGTRTILVRPDADRLSPQALDEMIEETEEENGGASARPNFVASNLVEAVRIIAQQRTPESADDAARKPPIVKKWDAAAVAQLQRPRKQPPRTSPSKPEPEPAPDPEPSDSPPEPKLDQAKRYRPVGAPPPREPGETRGIAPGRKPATQSTGTSPTEATPITEAPKPIEDDSDPQSPGVNKSLRLILQELRQQRGVESDSSNLRLLALVTQMMALICLLAALWLGAGDEQFYVFVRWIMTAVLAQLATIALLMFSRG